jgi:hypothetical protein
MISSTPPGLAHRNYVLRLINELLAWETKISSGDLPKPTTDPDELSSRLMLIDRLLTAPVADLATLGIPTPLPRPAELIDRTLMMLEARRAEREGRLKAGKAGRELLRMEVVDS